MGCGEREVMESRYRLKECRLATQQAHDVVTTSMRRQYDDVPAGYLLLLAHKSVQPTKFSNKGIQNTRLAA